MSKRPLVMGILNVTPDSFSDGGRFRDAPAAVAHARAMAEAGADIIDIGGESTRPGAASVDEQEELERVLPVITQLAAQTDAVLSIDTTKAAVAQRALDAGAHIINDVSALTHDPGMVAVAKNSAAGVVLMHMQGSPQTMQSDPQYTDVVAEVRDILAQRLDVLTAAGLDRAALAIDPGIGFGKTLEHNLALLRNLSALTALGVPVVVGLSRKSFLERLTGRAVDQRLAGSLTGLAWSVWNGAHIVRVHDVAESIDAVRVALALEGRHV